MTGRVFEDAVDKLPAWLDPLVDVARRTTVEQWTRFAPPVEGGRRSAVLVLLAGTTLAEADVLLIERAHDMRSHSGQPAFPGGAIDPTDVDDVDAALREATEETGLDRSGALPFGLLPDLFLPPSGFVVAPVLAWWRSPSEVGVCDPAEVASVHRVPLAELIEPARRVRVRHPLGYIGPGFEVRDLLVWGFTAGILDRMLGLTGWERPWNAERILDLPPTA
jgi:8-oxo-dGTP pyrophosphatase MutT (NUDIX family)